MLGLAAVGDAVYVANSHDGLRRLDVSDPSAPRLTGTSATRGQAVGVAVSGTHAFVGDNSLGFDVVDATGDVQRVGEYLGDGFPRGIAAAGPLVFVADQPAGLIVVNASHPGAPTVVGSLSLGRDPITQVFAPDPRSIGGAESTLVCIVSGRVGFQAVDVSDPAAPVVAAPVPLAGRPAGAAMWDRLVYAAGGDALQVFDQSYRRNPTEWSYGRSTTRRGASRSQDRKATSLCGGSKTGRSRSWTAAESRCLTRECDSGT